MPFTPNAEVKTGFIPEVGDKGFEADSGFIPDEKPSFDTKSLMPDFKESAVSFVKTSRMIPFSDAAIGLDAFMKLRKIEEPIFGKLKQSIQSQATTPSTAKNFAILELGEIPELVRPSNILVAKGLGVVGGEIASIPQVKPIIEYLKRETPTLQKLLVKNALPTKQEVSKIEDEARDSFLKTFGRFGTKQPLSSKSEEMAANINLSNIESGEDVKKVISETAKQLEGKIKIQTRGVVSNVETQRLAQELGVTVDDLISKAPGTIENAHKTLAYRQLHAASANKVANLLKELKSSTPGSDEEAGIYQVFNAEHGEYSDILVKLTGLTSELGRGLQAQKISVTGLEESAKDALIKAFVKDRGALTLKQARELASLVERVTPENLPALISKATRSTLLEKFEEFSTAAKLTNIKTFERNPIGNQVMNMIRFAEKPLTATNEAIASFFGGRKRQAFFGESFADSFGQMRGLVRGVPKAISALLNEEQALLETAKSGEAIRTRGGVARIPGKLGEIIRLPFRALTAQDLLQSSIVEEGEISALAYRTAAREGLKGEALWNKVKVLEGSQEVMNQAKQQALVATFREPLGSIGAKGQTFIREIPGSRLFMPFIRTIVNIGKQSARRLPPLSFLSPKNISDIGAGGLRRSEALSRIELGLATQGVLTWLALNGDITPSASSFSPSERETLRRTGYQFSSVKIGDKYYSYSNLQPLTAPLALASDTALSIKRHGEEATSKGLQRVVTSLGRNLIETNFLMGISELIKAIDEPEKYGGNFIEKFATGSTVPSGVGGLARAIDPTLRDPEGLEQAFESRLPGLTYKVPPKRDAFGEPIVSEGRFLFNLLSPVSISTVKQSRLEDELSRLDIRVNPASPEVDGKKLPQRQADIFLELTGQATKQAILNRIDNPFYEMLDDRQKRKVLMSDISDARETIREGFSEKTSEDRMSKKLQDRLDRHNPILKLFNFERKYK